MLREHNPLTPSSYKEDKTPLWSKPSLSGIIDSTLTTLNKEGSNDTKD